MTKDEMIAHIAEASGITKRQATSALDAFMDGVTRQLKKNEKISFAGFGTFAVSQRKARTGRNPQTGEAIKIPATRVPVFKAGKNLKEAIKKK
ncbi:MAG TPA: HU family DNA-binding protein [candidate division Zixibacteria bacterium]|nr:HU family DNA-binding protein [candidate division Zixibacteria bacterium]MDD4918701.1 HU family DNA-binding protein [candidate division Zixibacteria bacterium]MDM7973954.1 HU family DNA-binding protein [candidate division Zixibacteria bacterium]HOD65795.1 HU family DNA-binding protein [candidate division Zixibacteria bacterium]HOZ07795.1 HU family DNA-binding protein [candidate division Zixibacteria bacterium]